MRIIWSLTALSDLDGIADYVRQALPALYNYTLNTIEEAADSLMVFPQKGRFGSVKDTRELLLPRIPYRIVYSIVHDTVQILRVVHGARKEI